MLRTLPQTRPNSLTYRLAAVAIFTLLTVLSARVTLEIGVVPFTLQVLVVLLSGLVLGARDGLLSQAAYVALIAAGLPVDARGLGLAALFGPTGGYLLGFIAAAGLAGWLVERGANRIWQRWLAGSAGIAMLYLFGAAHLQLYTGMDWSAAWTAGVVPFIVPDLAKAVIAAALAEGGRKLLSQWSE
ncbi:MAG TPA: biotin transporter BioY [Phototrophicaceae bacterium]|nr:biotin transporter BioY [Phototrophicaceae bacterium]